ncbi:MAG: GIY-YIG nuclease family protein [Ferruginibacter sp.]
MLYTVYILFSEAHQKYYKGYSSDIEKRMQSHNLLGKDWTAKYRPWKINIYKKN